MMRQKVEDHRKDSTEFATSIRARSDALKTDPAMRADFVKEMRRFLPTRVVTETVEKADYWAYLTNIVQEEAAHAIRAARS